jgi:hypothetical protein
MVPHGVPYVGDRRVLALLYGSLLVPFVGPVLLAFVSSLAYYRLRRARPAFAAWLNIHSWIAIGLNVAAHLALLLVLRP